jgi:hypothetical protein
MTGGTQSAKRIAPGAYDALVDALAVVFWNKQPFERFLRLALQDHPELLAGLAFGGLKRQVASDLVMRLGQNEVRYQEVTLSLMLQVSTMEDFPNLRAQADGPGLIDAAREAVAALQKWTKQYGEVAQAHEKLRAEREAEESRNSQRRAVSNVLEGLRTRFFAMHTTADAQQRGRDFETLLNELFFLFDMNPRKSFVLRDEQIDGAFTFNTDDYLLEAKWEKGPASNEAVSAFEGKVRRKGKNTLGLVIAVSGFSQPAIRSHSNCGTALIFLDGIDLVAVLQDQIPFTTLLEAKRRHLSETGEPYRPVRDLLG